MSESDTAAISASLLLPPPPLLVSLPFLPSSTSSDVHMGSFCVAFFLSHTWKNATKQRSSVQRVCNKTNRVRVFPYLRGVRAITSLNDSSTEALSGSLSLLAPSHQRSEGNYQTVVALRSVSGTTSATVPPPT